MAYKDLEKKYWVAETRVTDAMGKSRKCKKRGFKTKKEAQEWEQFVKAKACPTMDILIEDFIEVYFDDKSGELKERSIKNKRYMMERHIIPFFKNKRMTDITVRDLIQWQNYMKSKEYSESYLRMINNQLTALFTHACKVYDLKVNPCKKVKRMGKSETRRLLFWEKPEYDKFIANVDSDDKYYALFETLFWTGMRIGECLALTPADIDFEKGIIHITKTYYRNERRNIVSTPKTENSIRDVVIPDFLVKELKDLVTRHYEMPDNERLFPIGQEAVQHKMKKLIKIAGVKAIPVHGLRHSACAYLISQGVDLLMIQKRLGHHDISITVKYYSALYEDADKKLQNMLSAAKKSPDDGNHEDS